MTARKSARKPARKSLPVESSRLPPIPRSIALPAGRVPVIRRKGLECESERCAGTFDWNRREILLDADLGITAAWLTLWHEWVHAVIRDAGVTFPESTEEAVADAIAAARVAEMLR